MAQGNDLASVAASRRESANGVGDLLRRDFASSSREGAALSIWSPREAAPLAIILVGHGGSQHRQAEMVVQTAHALIDRFPAYVAAIDGPLHGDRLAGDPTKTAQAFVQHWKAGDGGVPEMVHDWHGALARVRELPGAGLLPVGYYGVSMGTAYGLPFLASAPEVKAAVLGMWDAAFPNSDRVLAAAGQLKCPVQFSHREEDELFTLCEARRLFDAIAAEDKEFVVLPGGHGESAAQIGIAADFLMRKLF